MSGTSACSWLCCWCCWDVLGAASSADAATGPAQSVTWGDGTAAAVGGAADAAAAAAAACACSCWAAAHPWKEAEPGLDS